MDISMKNQIREKADRIESVISSFLPEETGYQKPVISAMNYTMNAGGKRLRPMLMEETFLMFGGADRDLIEPFMAAIEMIHTYSLIHDDLPALDNDDYRRGRKTAHIVYGEAMAILAGDGLLNYAFETASKAFRGDSRDSMIGRAFQVLASKPGIYGMIGGQTADVADEDKEISLDELLFIHKNKTSALIECSMMVGAILAGADQSSIQTIEKIAEKIGLAFQIQDDILDITGSQEELGKPVGSDEKNNKNTYVSIKGLERAKEDVLRYTREAIDLFDTLPCENAYLRQLLLYLSGRDK